MSEERKLKRNKLEVIGPQGQDIKKIVWDDIWKELDDPNDSEQAQIWKDVEDVIERIKKEDPREIGEGHRMQEQGE